MNNGGPAFPFHFRYTRSDGAIVTTEEDGMSLRDYFAAKAPSLPTPVRDAVYNAKKFKERGEVFDMDAFAAVLAEWNYRYADAMLEERAK